MEVPRLGVNWSCSCRPTPQPQQHEIQASSVIYTTVHSNARSLTHWARPGIKPESSWILVRFVNRWAMMGAPRRILFFCESNNNNKNKTQQVDFYLLVVVFSRIGWPNDTHNEKSTVNSSMTLNIFVFHERCYFYIYWTVIYMFVIPCLFSLQAKT